MTAETSTGRVQALAASPIGLACRFVVIMIGIVGFTAALFEVHRPVLEPSDFAADYASARAWTHGADPYSDTPSLERTYIAARLQNDLRGYTSLHPPIEIILALPLSTVRFRAAYAIWMIIMAGSLVCAIFLFARAVGLSSDVALPVALGSMALPTTRLALHNGEPNPLVLLLLVVSWLFIRSRREPAAGVLLGLAIAIKLFPALLLLPLLRMKRYKAAIWGVCSAATLIASSGLVIGIGATRNWISGSRANVSLWRAAGHNISLLAVPFRWLTRNPWFRGTPDMPVLATLLATALFLALLFAAWRIPATGSGDLFWATTPFMILMSPIAWADYLVFVFPLAILLLRKMNARNVAPIILGTVGVVLGRPIFVFVVNPISVARQVLLLSIPIYGLLLLIVSDWIGNQRDIAPVTHPVLAATPPSSTST